MLTRNKTVILEKPGHIRQKTLTARVEQVIREGIRSGKQYLPGSRLPTLRELATDFNVSHSTITGALHNLELEGWLERRTHSGLRVALDLPHQTVAFVSEEESRPWGPSIAELLVFDGVESVLDEQGYCARHFGYRVPGIDRKQVTRPLVEEALILGRKGLLSGVIIRGDSQEPAWLANQVTQLKQIPGLPVVHAEYRCKNSQASVYVDWKQMVSVQVKYLLEQGCRHIAMITSSSEDCTEDSSGYLKARILKEEFFRQLSDAGMACPPENIHMIFVSGGDEIKYGYGVVEHDFYTSFLKFWSEAKSAGKLPDGLVVTDDILGRAVASVLLAEQVNVPEQLKVVCYTNKDSGVYFPLPFARSETDTRQIGKEAARLVLRQIEGDFDARVSQVPIQTRLLPAQEWRAMK